MAELLAPGVFVKEVQRGPRPIEGVSTSSSAMVGLTSRGPENVPILVTSAGEYARWFGDRFAPHDVVDAGDPDRWHGYLPFCAEQFFTNGGRRLYVTRVMPPAAQRASFDLHLDPGGASETQLLRQAAIGDGTAARPLHVIDLAGLSVTAPPTTVRIGNGSQSEYAAVTAVNPAPIHVVLDQPLSFAYDGGTATAEDLALTFTGPALAFEDAASRGDRMVLLTGTPAVAVSSIYEIRASGGSDSRSEFRTVVTSRVVGGNTQIEFDAPLSLEHEDTDEIQEVDLSGLAGGTTLDTDASGGDAIVYVAGLGGGAILVLDDGSGRREVRRAGETARCTLIQPAYADYGKRSVVEHVALTDAGGARSLQAASEAGATSFMLDNRDGLDVGDIVRVGLPGTEEHLTIVGFPSTRGVAPDPGAVIVRQAARFAHGTGDPVQARTVSNDSHEAAVLLATVAEGSSELDLSQGNASAGYAAGDLIRIRTVSGGEFYHEISAITLLTPATVELGTPLSGNHEAGAAIAERVAALEVEALDRGAWGDRVRISVAPFERGLVSGCEAVESPAPNQVRLSSLTGVEAGSILQFTDPTTGDVVGDPVKVASTDPGANGLVTLDTAMPNAQRSAITTAPPTALLTARSIEFSLTIRLLHQPDPARPARARETQDVRLYDGLSLDPRHSRYAPSVVGRTDGDLREYDRRPEGEDPYVRLRDLAPDLAAAQAIRQMPEILVDTATSGLTQPAQHALSGGSDGIGSMTDQTYIGLDNVEPELRTGLFSLTTLPILGMVAVPGQTERSIQQALIDHCERDRYRFAILDGVRDAMLGDVLAQRQQYGSSYAAMYTPWLTVPHPFPVNPTVIEQFALPPSGAMMGLIARIDNDRGVHKAPANEPLRGITGLQRYLNKGEQEVINPSPFNINAIRRFGNRGIRAYGARVITDDTSLKYIPVRRLLLFMEQSIDIGLQWVVFEPNSEDLWARVRQSISGFLRTVWRDGALEGTEEEQAFFVKCDRTTMTQADIDNGRLICEIGVAPVKPAEFVLINIGLMTADQDN